MILKSSSFMALGLGFFEGFGEGGHDFEDVGDDAVVGDFEDGGVLIFVDGHDGARALHANDVLDGAADAEREIEFWRDGLAGAADLALHRKPAFVADRARRSDLSAERFGDGFGLRNIFGRLDAAADFASLKRSSGVVRICCPLRLTLTALTGALPDALGSTRSARNAPAWNDA